MHSESFQELSEQYKESYLGKPEGSYIIEKLTDFTELLKNKLEERGSVLVLTKRLTSQKRISSLQLNKRFSSRSSTNGYVMLESMDSSSDVNTPPRRKKTLDLSSSRRSRKTSVRRGIKEDKDSWDWCAISEYYDEWLQVKKQCPPKKNNNERLEKSAVFIHMGYQSNASLESLYSRLSSAYKEKCNKDDWHARIEDYATSFRKEIVGKVTLCDWNIVSAELNKKENSDSNIFTSKTRECIEGIIVEFINNPFSDESHWKGQYNELSPNYTENISFDEFSLMIMQKALELVEYKKQKESTQLALAFDHEAN